MADYNRPLCYVFVSASNFHLLHWIAISLGKVKLHSFGKVKLHLKIKIKLGDYGVTGLRLLNLKYIEWANI